MFKHHRQPRQPADLGYYDLRLPEVRRAQANLARYGISAFCYYYYYWFNGRRMLERPLDEVLRTREPDFPFLLCWANEPWTRSWDGGGREILVPQTYEPGWAEKLARDLAGVLSDRRYFCLEGRPVVLSYRPMHIPHTADSLAELRTELYRTGISDVHLSGGTFVLIDDPPAPNDPRMIGLDSYFEFPPHGLNLMQIPNNLLGPRLTS